MQRSAALFMAPTAALLNTWRDQGISYLKSLNIATEELHKCVVESKAAKYHKFSQPGYVAQQGDGSGLFTAYDKVPADPSDYADRATVTAEKH